MASYDTFQPTSARMRWRPVVAIVVACCAFAWEPIAAAPAATSHAAATPAPIVAPITLNETAPVTPGRQRHLEKAAAKAEGIAPVAPVTGETTPALTQPEKTAVNRARRSQPGRAPAGAAPERPTAAARRAARAAAPAARSRHAEDANSTADSDAVALAQAKSGGGREAPPRSKKAKVTKQEKQEKRLERRERKDKKIQEEGEVKGEGPMEEGGLTSSGPGSKSGVSEASSGVVADAADVAAPAASSGVLAAAAPSAQLAVGDEAAIEARARKLSKQRHKARAKKAGASGKGGTANADVLAPISSSAAAAAVAARLGTGGGDPVSVSAKKAPSPLATTITKIVGVVPLAVRVLIGLLVALALALALRSRLTARRARRLEQQRGQLLEDVGLLQAALLPSPPARLGPVGTSVAYRPADGPGAGGDFYDVFALEDGQLAVIVGDVSGHGRASLPHTALLRFTVRAYLEAGLSPRRALQTAGSVLERQLEGSFATVVAATYHPRERTLTYASAGHPPPVVLGPPAESGSRTITPVTASSSPPIGTGRRTGLRQTVVSVPGPSQLCFYTDGVTEARVGSELFGSERLTRGLAGLGREATASMLLDRVAEATDARPDDMAACLLRVEGGKGGPAILSEELELDQDELSNRRTEQFLTACGVQPAEASAVMSEARESAAGGDPVVLELHFTDGLPSVAVRQNNVFQPMALVAASAS
jgi:serine phosphatase RsbU (regulator of sigma subunit)